MAKLSVKEISNKARSIIASNPEGIRFTTLKKEIHQDSTENTEKVVGFAIFNLQKLFPDEIAEPDRGLFMPANALGA